MITFKQFLKQKKLYNFNADEDKYSEIYNKDMDVIDKDLEYNTEMDDYAVRKVNKIRVSDILDPSEIKDSESSNISDVSDGTSDVDEEGEGGGEAITVAPSVSADSGISGNSNSSDISAHLSTGGTTSADIASVPYGLTQKQKDLYSTDVISRMDSYI